MQGRFAFGPAVAAPRCLAVDGGKGRFVRPGLAHKSRERLLEQAGVDPVLEHGEPAPARRAALIGQIAPQEIDMGFAPRRDVLIAVAVTYRAAHREQQDFRQRIHHPPGFARIVDLRKVMQQRLEAGTGGKFVGIDIHGGSKNQGTSMESRFTQSINRR